MLSLLVTALIATGAQGEFRPYQSADFEDGRSPDSMDPFGIDVQNTLRIGDLSLVPNMPPAFRDETATRVTGKFGVVIRSDPKPEDRTTHWRGLSIGVIVDRDKLGASGRALYQADFYLPPADSPGEAPCIAILALDPTIQDSAGTAKTPSAKAGIPKAFYRFGLARGKVSTLYFSRILPNATTPPRYEQDLQLYGTIPRPGWHRFAMLFTGPEEIRFYLDNKEPRFSPIKDSELRKLKLGIMLAEATHKYDCYADNPTVLWSMDNSAVPESPFAPSWANVRAASGVAAAAGAPPTATDADVPRSTAVTAPPASGTATGSSAIPSLPAAPPSGMQPATPPPLPPTSRPLVWLDATSAWADAQRNRRNFLLFFFSPTDATSAGLDGLLDESPTAQSFVQACSKTKLDVTRQQGLEIARGYKIQAIPAMVLFSPDGEELGRAVYKPGEGWESFAARLGAR